MGREESRLGFRFMCQAVCEYMPKSTAKGYASKNETGRDVRRKCYSKKLLPRASTCLLYAFVAASVRTARYLTCTLFTRQT